MSWTRKTTIIFNDGEVRIYRNCGMTLDNPAFCVVHDVGQCIYLPLCTIKEIIDESTD